MATTHGIGADNLDARGYVRQYPTFRYHGGGYASYRADGFGGMNHEGRYNGLNGSLNFAIGLRRPDGTQIARAEFTPREKGTTKWFGGWIPAGNYATNARMVSSESFQSMNYACGWHGLLTLSST